jgi:hypothetical protein
MEKRLLLLIQNTLRPTIGVEAVGMSAHQTSNRVGGGNEKHCRVVRFLVELSFLCGLYIYIY